MSFGLPCWACKEQVAKSTVQNWVWLGFAKLAGGVLCARFCGEGLCKPRIDYADVRTRVAYAFEEQASELADTVSVLISLSREVGHLLEKITATCG